MNPEGKATLTELLHAALKSVTITQGGSGRLPVRDYRRVVQQHRATFDPALRRHASSVDIQVGDPKVREAVLNLLRYELKPFLREDRTYSASLVIVGGLGNGSSVEDILNNVVKSAIVFGPDQSASEFYGALKLGYITCQRYFLLAGMRVEKQIKVLDGVALVPLPNDAPRLPSFLPSMLDSGIDFTSKTLLRAEVSVSPLLHKPDQDYTLTSGPGRHFKTALRSTDATDFSPANFFRALTMFGDHPVQSTMDWAHLDDEHMFNLGAAIGSGYSYLEEATRNIPSTVFSEARVREALDLYFKLNSLPQEVKQRLEIPLDRWMKSKTQQSYVDKMIDLGIAFESFYLGGIRDELTFRFSLRASLFLTQEIEQRKKLKKELEEIYKHRSAAVHEGTLPEQVTIEGQKIPITQFLERSQELLKQSVLRVIEKGELPDWTSIELGGGDWDQ